MGLSAEFRPDSRFDQVRAWAVQFAGIDSSENAVFRIWVRETARRFISIEVGALRATLSERILLTPSGDPYAQDIPARRDSRVQLCWNRSRRLSKPGLARRSGAGDSCRRRKPWRRLR